MTFSSFTDELSSVRPTRIDREVSYRWCRSGCQLLSRICNKRLNLHAIKQAPSSNSVHLALPRPSNNRSSLKIVYHPPVSLDGNCSVKGVSSAC